MNALPLFQPPAPVPVAKAMPGRGTRLTSNDAGFAYSVPAQNTGFAHPFKPALGGFRLSFRRGIVQSEQVREPEIESVPIGGRPGQPQPSLKLLASVANANGESYAVLVVEPNEKGVLDGESRVIIEHTKITTSVNPKVGRQPIALILWRKGRPWTVLPIVHFNLRYFRVDPAPGGGGVRHLFL